MARDNYLDDDYWYTDQDMHSLLQHRLQGTSAVILAPIVLQGAETENHISLMEANIAASLGYLEDGSQSVVIPVHLNGNHWTGLVLEIAGEGYVGYYADSLGHKIPQTLK